MAFEKCKRCGFMHYSTDPCKSSAGGERIGAQAVHGFSGGATVQLGGPAVSNKPPADTKPKFDRNAYQRAYMRDKYRPRVKAKRETNA